MTLNKSIQIITYTLGVLMGIKDDLLNRRQMYIDTKCRINNDLDKLIKDCDADMEPIHTQDYVISWDAEPVGDYEDHNVMWNVL